jgi:hypothetical protein
MEESAVRLPIGRDEPPPRVVEPLEPIRIFLVDADLSGLVRPSSERTTDTLRRGKPLVFLPAGANPDEWMEIPAQNVLMVVPPPLARRFWKREQRVQRPVTLRVGPYAAAGTAYLRPGQEDDLFLRATRPFMPLTDAAVGLADESHRDRVETVIVNLNWVTDLHEA